MLGPPGAGKGTQAERLARTRKLPKISTGDILREAVQAGTEVGLRREGDDGRREPGRRRRDDRDRRGAAGSRRRARGFVLDGFPRTVVQATALDRMVDGRGPLVVLDIVVPEDVLVRRLAARRICGKCGSNAAAGVDGRLREVRRRAGHARRRRDRHRARAVEGLPAADEAARRVLLGAADVPAIDGNQPPDVVTGAVDAALDRALESAARGARAVIVCKSPAEIERMRAANELVADVLDELAGDGRAGRDDGGSRRGGGAAGPRGGRRAGVQGLPRLSRARCARR